MFNIKAGKGTLKLIINNYRPLIKFKLPQGSPYPKAKINHNEVIASFKDSEVKLSIKSNEEKIIIQKDLDIDEKVLGLGEKALPLNKRRCRVVFWNYDNYGYQFYSDPLYISIPFAIFVKKEKPFGLFINSPSFIVFDIGFDIYDKVTIEIYDKGAEIYIIFGSTISEIIERYTDITGNSFLPPYWALGFQISRYSYYPQNYVLKIVKKILKEVPLSAIYLDIDYMDRYKIFTWDTKKFPKPKQMIKKLNKLGVNVITIIDPFIKVDPEYKLFFEAKDFCLRKENGEIYITKGWPGDCIIPDFLNKQTRKWWIKNVYRFVKSYGINGIWLDMNEPTVFNEPEAVNELLEAHKRISEEERAHILRRYIELLSLAQNYLTAPIFTKYKSFEEFSDRTPPKDVLHQISDNEFIKHMYVRNAYPYFQAMATYKALKKIYDRPFILSRSGFAGIQKFAAVWIGDIPSTWESLKNSIVILLNLSLSGLALCGVDVGGYVGRSEPELVARWYQACAFIPIFRVHKEKGGNETELFNLPSKYKEMAKRAILLRYYFLPYLWHLAWIAHLKGLPIIRPLLFEFEKDEDCYYIEDEYMVGPYILFAPILEKGSEYREVYLPEGKWIDYWNGEVYDGKKWFKCYNEMPLFIRYNSAIPVENGILIFGEGSWEIYHGDEGLKSKIEYKNNVILQSGDLLKLKEVIVLGKKINKVLVDNEEGKVEHFANRTKILVKDAFNKIEFIY